MSTIRIRYLSKFRTEVKVARQGEVYEVMLKRSTTIKQSPRKLDVASLMPEGVASNVVTPASLDSMEEFEKVIVRLKLLEVKEKDVGGSVKRDDVAADGSAVARVSVWEGHVNAMEKGECYSLKHFMIRECQGTKYLIMPNEGAEIIVNGTCREISLSSNAFNPLSSGGIR